MAISFTYQVFIVSEIAKTNEDKFKKMKDIYGSLREEHLQLLRTVSGECESGYSWETSQREQRQLLSPKLVA